MNIHLYRGLLLAAALSLMAAIFGFSNQTGEESGSMSAIFTTPITEIIVAFQEEAMEAAMEAAEVENLYFRIDHLVRKAAHLTEYAILGLVWGLFLRSYGIKTWIFPFLIGSAYAATDEIHQLFLPDRAGLISDVILDSVGVFIGVMCVRLIKKYWRNMPC